MDLCKPANLMLLISIGGALYHMIVLDVSTALWWVAVGIIGVATFQGLCYSGVEVLAWLVMMIPVLLLCFFLAIALLASSMRIRNVRVEPNGYRHHCQRSECQRPECQRPKCQRPKCQRPTCDGSCTICTKEYEGEQDPFNPTWNSQKPVKTVLNPFTMSGV
jgi:hypothetical protein